MKPADTRHQEFQNEAAGAGQYDEWQLFFLRRLRSLLNLQAQGTGEEKSSLLIRKAIYSTLRDCTEQLVGEEAARLVKEGNPPASPN